MENHNYENEGQFQRKMTSRHLFMLSLGGVIGTGLFLSSGYTIAQAGPLGAILSYLVGAIVVYLVMLSLGELAVAMPVTGSFHTYATKFISPGTGFTVALSEGDTGSCVHSVCLCCGIGRGGGFVTSCGKGRRSAGAE